MSIYKITLLCRYEGVTVIMSVINKRTKPSETHLTDDEVVDVLPIFFSDRLILWVSFYLGGGDLQIHLMIQII